MRAAWRGAARPGAARARRRCRPRRHRRGPSPSATRPHRAVRGGRGGRAAPRATGRAGGARGRRGRRGRELPGDRQAVVARRGGARPALRRLGGEALLGRRARRRRGATVGVAEPVGQLRREVPIVGAGAAGQEVPLDPFDAGLDAPLLVRCAGVASLGVEAAERKMLSLPRYGGAGSSGASSNIRAAVSPAASQATICARYGSTFERR